MYSAQLTTPCIYVIAEHLMFCFAMDDFNLILLL